MQTDKSYEYWRLRILYTTMLGYIFFYFVRKNLSVAMPGIEADLGITKVQLGIFLSAHTLLYGFSRFCNGILADRINPRYFMAFGLGMCALANFGFGMSSHVWWMGVFWVANAWFQGMGFPPCAKSLTHWFAAEERGVKFSIWNTSHSIGAGVVMVLNGAVIYFFDDWRYCFFVPGVLAILGALFLVNRLRDTPESMGLEPIEAYYAKKIGRPPEAIEKAVEVVDGDEESQKTWGQTLFEHVYSNPAIWIISFANFFVYVVRFSIVDWAPTFLSEKGMTIPQAALVSSSYEFMAVPGMLCGGFLMDYLFRGRGGKTCFFYMLGCTLALTAFWWFNPHSMWANAVFLGLIGFFIYGPQCLIGVVAANLATKKAAAAANGLTGIFGYMSGMITGWGVGRIMQHYEDWSYVFLFLIGVSFIAMLLFLFVLNAAAPEQLAAEKAEAEKKRDAADV